MVQNNTNSLPLKEVVDFSLGGDWGKNPDEKLLDYVKVKVVRGTEFANWWKHKANTAALRQIKKSSFEKRQLKSGDLVVEVSGGGPNQPVGRVVAIDDDVIANSDYPLVCSNFFRQIRLKKGYVTGFVRLSIYFDYLSGKLDHYQTSSTNLRNLNFNDFLLNIEIPVLPKEEQELVANKLENAINTINLTKVKLTKVRILIKKFRQAILSAAVTGKLTEDWHNENNATNWNPKKLKDVCLIITDGDHQAPPKSISGIPFIVISDVNRGELNLETKRHVPKEYYENLKSSRQPQKGDVLYTVVGSFGIAVLVDTEDKFVFQRHIALLRPSSDILSDYLFYLLKSKVVFNQASEVATGTAQLTVPLSGLRNIEIDLPSIEEQQIIVKKIQQYFDVANQVEKQIEKAEKRVGKLTQAILAKTFRVQEV